MGVYDELMLAARRSMLGQISVTDRLIRQLYIRAAKSIEKQIANAKQGSLTERWLVSYKKQLDLEIEQLGRGIYSAIENAGRNAAEARVNATAEYLRQAVERAGIDDSFTATLSSVPTDTLRAMIDGKLYTDGRSLSKRIWNATGRLEGNIAEIIQQGVAQKMDTITLAHMLEAYVNPEAACPVDWHTLYPDIPFSRNIDYNALRLARTAITHVHWAAGKEAARKNPLCKGIKWHLSDQHYERQVLPAGEDVCDQYARHDEGLGIGVYPIDTLPMPHPNCICYQTEELPSIEEAARILTSSEPVNDAEVRRMAWSRGEVQDASLDADYERWKAEKISSQARMMANSGRRGKNYKLSEAEKEQVKKDFISIGGDPNMLVFDDYSTTGYVDSKDIIVVSGNVMPDLTGTSARDRMSARAVLAHEYYGHRRFRGTKLRHNSWNDEFRASYFAALNTPNLTQEERVDLMNDALDRAREAGITIRLNSRMRRLLYGY